LPFKFKVKRKLADGILATVYEVTDKSDPKNASLVLKEVDIFSFKNPYLYIIALNQIKYTQT
jgi:hypothetical protein